MTSYLIQLRDAMDALETSPKRVIQKTTETTDDLIGKTIANAVIRRQNSKVSQSSPQNNSEIITNQHDKIIPTERYISPELLMILFKSY